MSRRTILGTIVVLVLVSAVGFADPPIPEVRVVKPVGDVIAGPHGQAVANALGPAGKVLDAGACTPESTWEERPGKEYEGVCRRLRVVFGPIMAKPGQDDVLIQPVTFEKPLYDGYIVRFKPNAVDATGQTPPVENLHLHHGTWLNAYPTYGSSNIFIASGEEKTISKWPYRYGMGVGALDTWLFLHMVHNATPETFPVFVQYDLDFIAREDAEKKQSDGKPLITNSKPIWLDAGGGNFHEKTETYGLNPIFNIQKGFGNGVECRWPDSNCAGFNSSGNVSAQQGLDVSDEVAGKDYEITDELLDGKGEGTLILMGGHVHNGGLRTEVELVREINGTPVSKLINISEAYYWQNKPNTDRIGNRPVSWDYSQTGSTLDHGWAVNVKKGDILRLNGIYDTAIASWYEQMSIVMSWVVPGVIPEGIDVFAPGVEVHDGIPTVAKVPLDEFGVELEKTCVPAPNRICRRGQITHGQIPSSGNHGSDVGPGATDWAKVPDGQHLNHILIGGFNYGLTDMGISSSLGVTYVNLGESITFYNLDTAAYMWHTITRCAAPCTGPTTVDYPIPDGGSGNVADGLDEMDFDSTQLGIGTGPTQRVHWAFTPTEKGTFTFFCRVHPSMRGVFRVN